MVVIRTYTAPGLYKRTDRNDSPGFSWNAQVIVDNIIITTQNGLLKYVEARNFRGISGGSPSYGDGTRNINIKVNNMSGTEIAATNSAVAGNIILDLSLILVTLPCRIYIQADASTNYSGSQYVTANMFKEWKVYNCDSTADFVFADTTSYANILLLPDVNAYPTGKLLYIKDKTANAGAKDSSNQYFTRDIAVIASNTTLFKDNNAPSFTINSNSGCLTLFNNVATPVINPVAGWYIANYYPSTRQISLPTTSTTTPTGRKIASASINAINIFSTNLVGGDDTRKSGDNQVNLPVISAPSMCVVVYSGDTNCGRSINNALMFFHPNNIDNNTGYNSTNKPYIVTQSGINRPECSTGIVFISDGTRWYITGWFESGNFRWQTDADGGTIPMGVDSNQIDIVGDIGSGVTRNYYLPITPKINPGYFIISKQLSTSDFYAVQYWSSKFGDIANVFNENYKLIYYQRPQTNVCMWFVGIKDGTITRYYPIIAYFPYE